MPYRDQTLQARNAALCTSHPFCAGRHMTRSNDSSMPLITSLSRAIRPTVMREFIRCPYRAKLLAEGWRSPPDWDREPLMWMGSAVASGAEELMNARRDGREPDVPLAIKTSLSRDWMEPPRVTPWTWDRSLKVCGEAVAAIAGRYLCTGSDVIAVERDSGAGKPDLVYRHTNGRLRVVDWKCHRKIIVDLSYYDYDWQMWHYAWLTRELYSETPEHIEVVNIFFEPRVELVVHIVPVTDERIDEWLGQAEYHWARYKGSNAESGKQWTGCHVPYYRCEFVAHCHYGATLESIFRLDKHQLHGEDKPDAI